MPIFTSQDNGRNIRKSPVKSVNAKNDSISISKEPRIHYKKSKAIGSEGLNKIEEDKAKFSELLKSGKKIIISLSSSWKVGFPKLHKSQVITAFKKLGVNMVSEVALGSQEVSSHVSSLINNNSGKIYISSVCNSVIDHIQKKHPEYSKYIVPLHSPVIAHSMLLKETFGSDIEVVFVGPCYSRKFEAERYPEHLSLALSFIDLQELFEENNIDPLEIRANNVTDFEPKPAAEGSLFSIDGGMIMGVKEGCKKDRAEFMSFSGIDEISDALTAIDEHKSEKNLFIELTACQGGCINGPLMKNSEKVSNKRAKIINSIEWEKQLVARVPTMDIKIKTA